MRFRAATNFSSKAVQRWSWAATAATGLAIVGVPASQRFGGGVVTAIVFLAGLLAFGASVAGHVLRTRFRERDITIDRDAVRLDDDQITIPRADIINAYFAPGAGRVPSAVRLIGKGNTTLAQIAVVDAAHAGRVLDALEVGGVGARRALAFETISRVGSPVWWIAFLSVFFGALALGLGAAAQSAFVCLAGLASLLIGSLLFLKSTVYLGADGILLKHRIRPEFISWADIAEVKAGERGVSIIRKGGRKPIYLAVVGRTVGEQDTVLINSLVAQSREALAAYQTGEAHSPDASVLLTRGGRTHAEWLKAVFAHFQDEGSFRAAPLLDDQLWAIVENATTDASARAGAAAVLARRSNSNPEASSLSTTHQRLRIAADACTEPRLRVVLDKAASGATSTEVEQALLELSEHTDDQDQQQQTPERRAANGS